MISPVSLTPPPAKVDMSPLSALVERLSPGAPLQYASMAGGASTRRYFRVFLPAGTTAVAMFVPEGGRPEEVQKLVHGPRWPFLEVRDLLADRGVDVPEVLVEDCTRGWILIEDLGDDTLANYLKSHPEEKTALYTRAVADLARAQGSLAALPAGSIISSRAFDEDLLRWEIDHFREWGIEGRDRAFSAEDRAAFDRIGDHLARRIATWRRGFTHRDYQSRNLMVRPDRTIAWIDFQDALLGPRVYDLVALLNDSYQAFDRAFVMARLGEFADVGLYGQTERADLVREFDYVTVQRKLKDAGRFVFIDRVKHNSSFLRFVTPTVKKVNDALGRLEDDPEMCELREILRRTLPDEML